MLLLEWKKGRGKYFLPTRHMEDSLSLLKPFEARPCFFVLKTCLSISAGRFSDALIITRLGHKDKKGISLAPSEDSANIFVCWCPKTYSQSTKSLGLSNLECAFQCSTMHKVYFNLVHWMYYLSIWVRNQQTLKLKSKVQKNKLWFTELFFLLPSCSKFYQYVIRSYNWVVCIHSQPVQ